MAHQNNSFVNQMQLPSFCERSGAICILLVLMDLTAGQQASRQVDSQMKNWLIQKILNFCADHTVKILRLIKEHCYHSLTNVSVGTIKVDCEECCGGMKIGMPCFLSIPINIDNRDYV